MIYIKNLFYLIAHKVLVVYILRNDLKRALKHDNDKFRWKMFTGTARFFKDGKVPQELIKQHRVNSDHHIEYYKARSKPHNILKIEEDALAEMIADWWAASRLKNGAMHQEMFYDFCINFAIENEKYLNEDEYRILVTIKGVQNEA